MDVLRRGRWPILLLVSALAWACGPEPALRRVERFIGDQAPSPRPPAGPERMIFEGEWPLASVADLAPWLRADLEATPGDDFSTLAAAGPDPRLGLKVDLDTSRIDELLLEGCADSGAPASLAWSAPGEVMGDQKRVVAEPAGPCRQLFRVAGHPGWHGRVQRLLLKPLPGGGSGKLVALRAGRRLADPGALAAPFQVDLQGDQRLALLAFADAPWRQRFAAPAGAFFRASCGPTDERWPQGCAWRLEQGGAKVAEGALPAAAGWQELELDLAPWRGETLELVVTPAEPGSPLALANPELLGRVEAQGPRRPNVLLISVDTLRADHLSLYGHPRPTSPRLEAWAARRAVVFEQAVASAPWTLPTHTTMLSGLETLRHGVNYSEAAPDPLDLLAEKLRRQGYRTAAYTGGAFLAPYFGLSQGFELYRYPDKGQPGQVEAGKDLEANLALLLRELDGQTSPFFLFLHTYQVHAPFESEPAPPAPLDAELRGALAARGLERATLTQHGTPGQWVLKDRPGGAPQVLDPRANAADADFGRLLYDAGIARTDLLLDQLFAALRASGLEKDTLVILTSDHGEALGEHQLTGHDALYDVNLLVPLVIALPDGAHAGERRDRQVRQSDLVPTILEVAGLPAEPALDGRSLLPLLRGEPVDHFPGLAIAYGASNNRGLALRWQGRQKLIQPNSIFPGPAPAAPELFDLRADPGELRNLAATGAGAADAGRLRSQAAALEAAVACPWRFTVANPGEGRLSVAWVGAKVNVFRVKSLEDQPGATYTAPQPQRLELALEPGGRASFCLETLYPAAIRVELAWKGPGAAPPPAVLALEPGRVGTRRLSLQGGAWAEGAGPLPAGAVGFAAETSATAAAGPAAEIDEELRRQLESLGYLDRP